jgi:hypothetical protein
MTSAFNMTGSNQTIVANDGGADGYTSVPILDEAAGAFVSKYAVTRGDRKKSIEAAQTVITNSPYDFPPDKTPPGKIPYTDKGDKLQRRDVP